MRTVKLPSVTDSPFSDLGTAWLTRTVPGDLVAITQPRRVCTRFTHAG